MSKRNKIIYWVATAWLAVGMLLLLPVLLLILTVVSWYFRPADRKIILVSQ